MGKRIQLYGILEQYKIQFLVNYLFTVCLHSAYYQLNHKLQIFLYPFFDNFRRL